MKISTYVVACALALQTAGCSSYAPITAASAPAGSKVRVTLTDQALLKTYGDLGTRVRVLYGTVKSAGDSSLTLNVSELDRIDQTHEDRASDVVQIASGDIASIEQEHVSAARSVLAAGVIGGGLALIATQMGGAGGTVKAPGGPATGGN